MISRTVPPRLLARLRANGDGIAHAIAEAVRREVAEYEVFDSPEAFAEVVADTLRHLELVGRCAPSGRMPNRAEVDFILDLAHQRAVAGFPLEAMLQAFRVGHRVLWDWLINRQTPDPGEKSPSLLPRSCTSTSAR